MDKERELELLAYAIVCFKRGTSPFETVHLIKKKVTADECKDLSNLIADTLEDNLEYEACINAIGAGGGKLGRNLIIDAEVEFMETQK